MSIGKWECDVKAYSPIINYLEYPLDLWIRGRVPQDLKISDRTGGLRGQNCCAEFDHENSQIDDTCDLEQDQGYEDERQLEGWGVAGWIDCV